MGKTYKSEKLSKYDDFDAHYRTDRKKKKEIKKSLETKKVDKRTEYPISSNGWSDGSDDELDD